MSLAFLVPAFLAGALAIGLPIWVHLRNRPKTDTVEFPSLMFIERIPYRAVQRQQLRHRLLFAMRCLAILLLVLAFARPFFGDSVATSAGRGAREVVVLLDRSWSMGYEGHWDAAMDAVRTELADLGGADRVTLIAFDEGAEVLIESGAAAAVPDGLLAGLQPGHLATSYGAAIRAAARVLDASTLPARELVLVSDFQRTGKQSELEVRLPEGTAMRPVNVVQGATPNAGIAALNLTRSAGEAGPELAVSARLTRQAGTEALTVPARLLVDGEEVQRRPALLPAAGAARVDFDPVPADVDRRIEVQIDPDALAGDDVFRAVASQGETLRVLLLDNPTSGGDDSLYVARALSVGTRPAFEVDRQVLRDLRLADLADTDLVILNDAGDLDTGTATALGDFVESGGGVVLGVAELASAGAHPLLPFEVGPIVDRSGDLGATLGFVDTAHPVFEAYRNPEAGDLSGARFYRYRSIAPEPSEGVLARFDDSSPAVLSIARGEGRVILWNSSLDTFWTDLPLQPIFVPVMHELVKYGAGYREADAWFDATASRAPGFYREEEEPGIVADRAVNLARAEADLTAMDPEELLASVAWNSGAAIDGEEAATPDPTAIEAGQSLWWYLVVVAMIMLLAETALSNRLSSRASWGSAEPDTSPGTER